MIHCGCVLVAAMVTVAMGQPTPVPTLQTRTRLVILDVVVTEHGAPVHGLKAADFSVEEDKKPQTIKSFEEHAAATPAGPEVPLPTGVFSNRTGSPGNGPTNIVLIDMLNSPPTAVKRLNQQVQAYLRRMKPGTRLAIFSLHAQLRYMQGFTSDQALLIAATQKSLDRFQTEVFPLQRMLATPCENQQRPFYTRAAMKDMARYLAAIPGRKNLIWFSARFPFADYTSKTNPYDPPGPATPPDPSGQPPPPGPCDMAYSPAFASEQYHETTRILEAAQIAVYLGDMRGLDGADPHNGSETPEQVKADEDVAMRELAHDTGGSFVTNSNDFAGFIEKSIEDGSSYYTLTYDPANKAADGKFRKVQVALAAKGMELSYRRGYYAEDAKAPKLASADAGVTPAQKAASTAMRHGLPGPTEILLKTFVAPASEPNEAAAAEGNALADKVTGPFRRYLVSFAAAPAGFTFTKVAEGKYEVNLEFVTVCYDTNGATVNSIDKLVKATVSREDVAAMVKTGYTFRETVSVPTKGDYSLRIGVRDVLSRKMGVVEVPVDAVKGMAVVGPVPQH